MNEGVNCLGGEYWKVQVHDLCPIDHMRSEVNNGHNYPGIISYM